MGRLMNWNHGMVLWSAEDGWGKRADVWCMKADSITEARNKDGIKALYEIWTKRINWYCIRMRKAGWVWFDLKTIIGKNSVDNRLSESIGQTNRVLLHMTADYNPGTLARSIKRFFDNKRATWSDSLFVNGVVSIKSCSHAETYRIAKTNVLTRQR